MKLCQFCNESTCGSQGSHSVSYECGRDNYKLSCAVFTNDLDKAQEIIFKEIEGQEPVEAERSQAKIMIETKTERWITYPLREWVRGIKPQKVYIDKNVSVELLESVIKPRCFSCLSGYPKFF